MNAPSAARPAIIEILGDARLCDPRSFYGQNALKATLLRRTSGDLDWHFVGTAPECVLSSAYARYHCVPPERTAVCLPEIVRSVAVSRRVPVFASFLVQSTGVLQTIAESPALRKQCALHVVLHCTAEELLPHLFGGGQTAEHVGGTLRMIAPAVEKFIYASDSVRDSFLQDEVLRFFGDAAGVLQRSVTISNTIDTQWLVDAPRYGVLRQDASTFVVGCMAGFKPYKGRDVVLALLRAARDTAPKHWRFAFAALPNYGTRDLLHHLDAEFNDFVTDGRVVLFADVSQWIDIAPGIGHSMREALAHFSAELPSRLRACLNRAFVGVLTESAQAQFDVQIRPSLHEGFGRAVFESIAIGVPVVTSDRDALGELLPAEATIPFSDAVSLASAVAAIPPNEYIEACAALGRAFLASLAAIEARPHTAGLPATLAPLFAVDRMVAAYREIIDGV